MDEKQRPIYPSPPYTGALQELAAPQDDKVRVSFACPHCGTVLERIAKLDETRWYLPGCSFDHSGVGIHDPSLRRIPFDPAAR